ncbi:hypothetical protein AYI70_g5194 [Smittium culicis]|uniref:Uncharacterized protein n=1 Tax=Smittium culicis TaxID=133412 RepID=A0A1R1XDR7_9FUNG|nr:hypothetical protein AYI70_g8924 [Smittium culicis]OMJ18713.1 hypothetical protein AYI70_g5194 [Smittium culicis]
MKIYTPEHILEIESQIKAQIQLAQNSQINTDQTSQNNVEDVQDSQPFINNSNIDTNDFSLAQDLTFEIRNPLDSSSLPTFIRVCRKCLKFKPPRTHHCKVCNK